MTDDWKIQISYKVGQDMLNVRANDPTELANILPFLPVDKIAQGRTDLDAAFAVGSAGILKPSPLPNYPFPASGTVTATQPVTTFQGVGPLTAGSPVNPAPSAVSEAAPVGAQATGVAIHETQDRYGNKYTWNLPGAPSCAHGVMPRKEGNKQGGGTYKRWECVGASKAPFVPKEQRCAYAYID